MIFFVPSSAQHVFGDGAKYIIQSPFHKLRLPAFDKETIWHATHQGTDYYPFRHSGAVILSVHDLNFLHDADKPANRKKNYLRALQKKVDRADAISCISQFTKVELQQYVHIGNKPVEVIYNGCNISINSEIKAPVQPISQPFLFTIGTCASKKNFHTLPALLKGNEFYLVISGAETDKAYKQKIIEEARQQGVEKRVVFTGPVSEAEKRWYYQHCEAFVFPSLAEGFGLPVIEAMFFGKPVFLSNCTSLPEIGGEVAFYFDSFEPEAMQWALSSGLNTYYRSSLKEQLIQRAASFTWAKAAAAYWRLYKKY